MTQNSINNHAGAFSCTSETIDPGASGDSFVQFDINTTGEFRIGVDDTDDSFRISQGSALGTSDTFIMTASGENTMPLQPAFLAYLATSDNNVTGNGGYFILGDTDVGTALTEVFDQGGDFSSGSSSGAIFTAPITGRYIFNTGIRSSGYVAATSYIIDMNTSNRRYNYVIDPLDINSGPGIAIGYNVIADMDANDVCYVRFSVGGEGADIIDISGSASADTFFSGALIC